ncbi:hypothetical protein P8452_47040 [Trifolium repens]|nr:hypothetical protein P8452_47040 [Trifolium repens]
MGNFSPVVKQVLSPLGIVLEFTIVGFGLFDRDQASTDTRVICATHINHNDLGIWISIDSKWSIQTPAKCFREQREGHTSALHKGFNETLLASLMATSAR